MKSGLEYRSLTLQYLTIFQAASFFIFLLLPKIAFTQLRGDVNPSPPADIIVPFSESEAEYSLPCRKVIRILKYRSRRHNLTDARMKVSGTYNASNPVVSNLVDLDQTVKNSATELSR